MLARRRLIDGDAAPKRKPPLHERVRPERRGLQKEMVLTTFLSNNRFHCPLPRRERNFTIDGVIGTPI